jgi:hypothetical protein
MTSHSFSFAVPLGLVVMFSAAVVLSEDEHDKVCRPGFSQSLRLAPDSAGYRAMRDAAFARAGIPTSMQCHRGDTRQDCRILDHIKPLELDPPNPNGLDNLQVQTRYNSAVKDLEENQARKEYCAGKITQEEALVRFKRSTP